jgi:hypothetical protein
MTTLQEAFDVSTRGIIAQGGPAYEYGNCLYRTKDGKKCAFGQLIPDEYYRFNYERRGAETVLLLITKGCFYDGYSDESKIIDKNFLKGIEPKALRELQFCHDLSVSKNFWTQFKDRLNSYADAYQLNKDVLTEIPEGNVALG